MVLLGDADAVSVRDFMTGVQVFGATGSGKTSGSMACFAEAMLKDDWGLLVLTTRVTDADIWEQWAARAGRSQDVLRIRADGQHRFNFLEYLNSHPVPGVSIATNIADVVMSIAKHTKPTGKQTEASQFFAEAATRMVTMAIHLVRAAGIPLTLGTIGDIINAAPTHPLEKAEEGFEDTLIPELIDRAGFNGSSKFDELGKFWLREFPGMNERTRGDVISTLTSVVHRFGEQPIADLMTCERGSSFIPEMVDQGRIMILDCPVTTYGEAGRLFQIAMKYLVQRMVLRRVGADTTRPVAIVADESHNFVTQFDYQYQAVCRDPRGCTVYATQSIDNYREATGTPAATEALLASLVNKVFHANAGNTNDWAQSLIAGDWRRMSSESMNQRDQGGTTHGTSFSEQISPQVPAVEFTRLRSGGPEHRGMVDAIFFQTNRVFATGKPFFKVTFIQHGFEARKGR
ncbi:MAG: hypothetical protein SFZ23_10450 [Planctomycetota bacterium]|nr:hypothetical protein [Planctomycetota bacterium]